MADRLFGGTLRSALVHAATRYDERQARGKRYNPYALGHYLKRIDEVCADVAAGADTRQAICAAFTGSLLSAMLKGALLAPPTPNELRGDGRWSYRPIANHQEQP